MLKKMRFIKSIYTTQIIKKLLPYNVWLLGCIKLIVLPVTCFIFNSTCMLYIIHIYVSINIINEVKNRLTVILKRKEKTISTYV